MPPPGVPALFGFFATYRSGVKMLRICLWEVTNCAGLEFPGGTDWKAEADPRGLKRTFFCV